MTAAKTTAESTSTASTSTSVPYPLGVSLRPDGKADVAVYSETADSVTVVIVDESNNEVSSTDLGSRTALR